MRKLCLTLVVGCFLVVVSFAEARTYDVGFQRADVTPISILAKGTVRGVGDTKADALADASSRVPSGATTGGASFSRVGKRWACRLEWTKD
jgi:hypothetical protein